MSINPKVYRLSISRVERWTQLNQYEGLVKGDINGRSICLHFVASSEAEWSELLPNTNVDVEVWLARVEELPLCQSEVIPPTLQELTGEADIAHYTAQGKIVDFDKYGSIYLETGFLSPLMVDMEIPSHLKESWNPEIGKFIQMLGSLRMDIPDQ